MTIYGFAECGVLSPISSTKEDLKEMEGFLVTDIDMQNSIISELRNLENIEFQDGIDNLFFIEIECKNSGLVEVESNCYITSINNNFYKPTEELIELVGKSIRKDDSKLDQQRL